MANRAARQLKEEIEEKSKQELSLSLRRGKLRYKKTLDLLKHLCLAPVRGEAKYRMEYVDSEDAAAFENLPVDHTSFVISYRKEKREDKAKFWDFISLVEAKSSLTNTYSPHLFWNIFSYDLFWQQDLNSWSSKSNNDEKQFYSLVNHLFAKFPLPKFALNIWKNNYPENRYINWFFHLAEGKNIRCAENLPFRLSPRMAHCFLSAPEDYSFEKAFLFGQLVSFGAEKRLIDELCNNLRIDDLKQNDFWSSYYKMLVASPFFDLVHVQPLRDFILHKKNVNPNYSLKGRNLQTLLNQMEHWHRELARAQVQRAREAARERNQARVARGPYIAPKPVSYTWKASFSKVYEFKEGGKTNWQIFELTSSAALSEDGSELRHCVGSYASSCHAKRVSILSLTCNGKKTATLEVDLSQNKLVQARGKCNRKLTEKEQRIVTQWCSKNAVSPGGF